MKRYNLVIPISLFDEIQLIAKREKISVADVFRKFIKLGLIVDDVNNNPDSFLTLHEGNTETQLRFIY